MSKVKTVSMIAIIAIGLFGYFIGNNTNKRVETKIITAKYISLPNKETVVEGISSKDQKVIEDFTASFYGEMDSKDVKKLLAHFSTPSNEQEQNDLDSLLAKDLAFDDPDPLPRLFSTQLYNYSLGAYELKSIKKTDNSFTVEVDEMRVIYSGLVENGGDIGYTAKVTSFTLELNTETDGFKILKYYHKDASTPAKYQGFEAS